MNDISFDKFMLLVEIDRRIHDVSSQKKEAQLNLEQINKEIQKIKETLFINKQELLELQKKVSFHDLELKTLDSKLVDKKNNILLSSNVKEYTSLFEEIISLEREREVRDEDLLFLWQELEAKNNYIKESERSYLNDLENLTRNFEKIDKLVLNLDYIIQELSLERLEVLKLIPEDYISDYICMYKQVPNPAIRVKGECCGACFCILPSADLSILKRSKLLRCKQCYRILFIDSE